MRGGCFGKCGEIGAPGERTDGRIWERRLMGNIIPLDVNVVSAGMNK